MSYVNTLTTLLISPSVFYDKKMHEHNIGALFFWLCISLVLISLTYAAIDTELSFIISFFLQFLLALFSFGFSFLFSIFIYWVGSKIMKVNISMKKITQITFASMVLASLYGIFFVLIDEFIVLSLMSDNVSSNYPLLSAFAGFVTYQTIIALYAHITCVVYLGFRKLATTTPYKALMVGFIIPLIVAIILAILFIVFILGILISVAQLAPLA